MATTTCKPRQRGGWGQRGGGGEDKRLEGGAGYSLHSATVTHKSIYNHRLILLTTRLPCILSLTSHSHLLLPPTPVFAERMTHNCDITVTFHCLLLVCGLQVIAVKAPGFGERKSQYLEDMATLTGAQIVKDELGISLDKATEDVLGLASKVWGEV